MRNAILGSALLAVGAVAAASCAPAVTCGEGTKLNEENSTCVPTSNPDFNVIIDDFTLGDFGFSNVDVPEQMQPGFTDPRSFTITNAGEEDQPVTLVRLSIVPVDETIDELQDAVDQIGGEASCESDAECDITQFCDTNGGICKLNATMIGSVVIENLAAGEERDIDYDLSLPPTWAQPDGVYGLLFTVNEVKLVKDAEGINYIEDPEHPIAADEDPFARAAALYPAATMLVGVPDKPNLRVLFANTDTSAFGISDGGTPIMTISTRISAQGKDVSAPVHAKFELEMPGHVIDEAGKDQGLDWFYDNGLTEDDYNAAPDVTTYVYDADRRIPLLVDTDGNGLLKDQVDWSTECYDEECSVKVTVQNDIGRDGGFQLHLSKDAKRILGATASLADMYPEGAISEDLELQGTVHMHVWTDEDEYEVGGEPLLADNDESFDVVFMAPEPPRDASPDDTEVPPYDEPEAPYPVKNAPGVLYGEVDNLTPDWNFNLGNEWVGFDAKISNKTSKARQFGAVVAQNVVSDNYARVNALKQQLYIVQLTGNMDWGTRRDITENHASGKLQLLGATYLDITYTPGTNCSEDPGSNYKKCLVYGDYSIPKQDAPPTQKPASKKTGKKIKVQYTPSKSWWFALGPLPFQIEVGMTLGLGMQGDVSWVQVRDGADCRSGKCTSGLQVTYGPVAQASGNFFGGLSIALLRAGIAGSLTYASLEFQPALLLGITQQIDENDPAPKDCWTTNAVQAIFTGPLTFKQLYGEVKIVVEGGICVCLPWAGCPCVWGEIWSYSLYKLDPLFEKTWDLFNITKDLSSGAGICAGAPPPATETWSTAVGCYDWYGRNSYCLNTNYSRTFNISSCKTMKITGETENGWDWVTVTVNGSQIFRKSGYLNDTLSVCGNATVNLWSDEIIVAPGITVTVQ